MGDLNTEQIIVKNNLSYLLDVTSTQDTLDNLANQYTYTKHLVFRSHKSTRTRNNIKRQCC